MTYRISVDEGGTFTDVVVADQAGALTIGKALTTPERAFSSVSDAIRDAAEQLGLSPTTLLAKTTLFTYGTTRATNAIVTGQGAKTAFLTTAGFPDTLVLKEGGKRNPHDFSVDFPEPYIPRRRTFEIAERINSEGIVLARSMWLKYAGPSLSLRKTDTKPSPSASFGRSQIPHTNYGSASLLHRCFVGLRIHCRTNLYRSSANIDEHRRLRSTPR